MIRKILIVAWIFYSFVPAPLNAESKSSGDWVKVSWTTPDGVVLKGLYRAPRKRGQWVWVFLHGLGSVKEEWEPFAREVVKSGQGVFFFDARGHHESVHTATGASISYQAFSREDWAKMPQDLSGAVEMLDRRYLRHKGIFGIAGASLGANVALLYAAQADPSRVRAVLLLSPGIDYAGLSIDAAFNAYGQRPLCMAASPGDAFAFQTVRMLAARRTDSQLRVFEGKNALHGVQMLDPQMTSDLLAWMRQTQLPTASHS